MQTYIAQLIKSLAGVLSGFGIVFSEEYQAAFTAFFIAVYAVIQGIQGLAELRNKRKNQ